MTTWQLSDYLIFGIGFLSQACFSMRILVQWIVSEKNQRVVTPLSYWIFSLMGALLMIVYGILRQDPVILLGQSFGTFAYIRGIILDRRGHHQEQSTTAEQ